MQSVVMWTECVGKQVTSQHVHAHHHQQAGPFYKDKVHKIVAASLKRVS